MNTNPFTPPIDPELQIIFAVLCECARPSAVEYDRLVEAFRRLDERLRTMETRISNLRETVRYI